MTSGARIWNYGFALVFWASLGLAAISGLVGAVFSRYDAAYTVRLRHKFWRVELAQAGLRFGPDPAARQAHQALLEEREPLAEDADQTVQRLRDLGPDSADDPEQATAVAYLRDLRVLQQAALAAVDSRISRLAGPGFAPAQTGGPRRWLAARPWGVVWRPYFHRRPDPRFVLPLWLPAALGLAAAGLARFALRGRVRKTRPATLAADNRAARAPLSPHAVPVHVRPEYLLAGATPARQPTSCDKN